MDWGATCDRWRAGRAMKDLEEYWLGCSLVKMDISIGVRFFKGGSFAGLPNTSAFCAITLTNLYNL